MWIVYASCGIMEVLRHFGRLLHNRGKCTLMAEIMFARGTE